MILEYKLERDYNGNLRAPSWVECGGFLFNHENRTYIGFSPEKRDYKIPDTVTKLTLLEAQARALSIHSKKPMKNIEGVILTTQQVNDMVQAIVDSNDIT